MGDGAPMDTWGSFERLAQVAAGRMDESEREALSAVAALDARLAREFAWLPWAALGGREDFDGARALRRAAWSRRLARDLEGNLGEGPACPALDRAREALGALCEPARVAKLWSQARRELAAQGPRPGLSALAGALSAGPGPGSAWRRLFGALDALDVAEGDEERACAAAWADREEEILRGEAGQGGSGEARRL